MTFFPAAERTLVGAPITARTSTAELPGLGSSAAFTNGGASATADAAVSLRHFRIVNIGISPPDGRSSHSGLAEAGIGLGPRRLTLRTRGQFTGHRRANPAPGRHLRALPPWPCRSIAGCAFLCRPGPQCRLSRDRRAQRCWSVWRSCNRSCCC